MPDEGEPYHRARAITPLLPHATRPVGGAVRSAHNGRHLHSGATRVFAIEKSTKRTWGEYREGGRVGLEAAEYEGQPKWAFFVPKWFARRPRSESRCRG
jgi:hypothetical protein